MPKISVDSNIFIYVFNADEAFVQHATNVLEKAEQQGAVVTVLLLTEMLHGALGVPKDEELIHDYLQAFRNLTFVPVSPSIATAAGKLLGRYPALRIGDAIHLATAAEAGADEFWTNDRKLKKIVIKGLRVRMLPEIGLPV